MKIDSGTLQDFPTIHQGHFANLKIDTGQIRVWLSRMTIADGEVEPVIIEKLVGGVWVPFHGDVMLLKNGTVYCVSWIHRASVGGFKNHVTRQYDRTVYPWPGVG